MKPTNVFLTKQGTPHHTKMEAILDDIKFELLHCINDFNLPCERGVKRTSCDQVIAVLRWLNNNRDRAELKDFFDELSSS